MGLIVGMCGRIYVEINSDEIIHQYLYHNVTDLNIND